MGELTFLGRSPMCHLFLDAWNWSFPQNEKPSVCFGPPIIFTVNSPSLHCPPPMSFKNVNWWRVLIASCIGYPIVNVILCLSLSLDKSTFHYFLNEVPFSIERDHALVRPIADAILKLTKDPLVQSDLVEHYVFDHIKYVEDDVQFGREYQATLTEMISLRSQRNDQNLCGDCDERAILAANLFRALGIPYKLRVSLLWGHAWVDVTINGKTYSVLHNGIDPPTFWTFIPRLFAPILHPVATPIERMNVGDMPIDFIWAKYHIMHMRV